MFLSYFFKESNIWVTNFMMFKDEGQGSIKMTLSFTILITVSRNLGSETIFVTVCRITVFMSLLGVKLIKVTFVDY